MRDGGLPVGVQLQVEVQVRVRVGRTGALQVAVRVGECVSGAEKEVVSDGVRDGVAVGDVGEK